MQVSVTNEIWLAEQWFERSDGWEHSEIVMRDKHTAEIAEKDGWTVTKYVIEDQVHLVYINDPLRSCHFCHAHGRQSQMFEVGFTWMCKDCNEAGERLCLSTG